MDYTIGVDIGGTFTDCVVLDEGGFLVVGKALSTPKDFSIGAMDAVRDAAQSLGLSAPEHKIKGVAYGVVGLKNSGQGVFGGYPGAPSVVVLSKGTRVRELIAQGSRLDQIQDFGGQANSLPYCAFEVGEDDMLYTRQSSGGGYGDPLERDLNMVFKDVILGLVSPQAAREVYGVVIHHDSHQVDIEATERLRSTMGAARLVHG